MSRNVSIKRDELIAMIILEELYRQEFYKSERPDLYSKDVSMGVEVTRAYDIEYEKDNGELRYSQQHDIADKYAYLYDHSLREVTDRIAERLVDKMKKLVNYKHYPKNYLYMRTSLMLSTYPFKLLSDEFDKMKQFVIGKCENMNPISYDTYDLIILECSDGLLLWNWNTDDLTIKPDVLGSYSNDMYTNVCEKANALINDEVKGLISAAGDHTPRKKVGW